MNVTDENSNQSSIADASPVKAENSCSTSPAPEATAASLGSESENKMSPTDQGAGERLILCLIVLFWFASYFQII